MGGQICETIESGGSRSTRYAAHLRREERSPGTVENYLAMRGPSPPGWTAGR